MDQKRLECSVPSFPDGVGGFFVSSEVSLQFSSYFFLCKIKYIGSGNIILESLENVGKCEKSQII